MATYDDIKATNTISILGCGWLGKPLGTALNQSGYSVFGSTTTTGKLSELRDAGIKPFLIHFSPGVTGDETQAFFQTQICIVGIPPALAKTNEADYLGRMRSICKELVRGGVSKVLFISSTSVYNGKSGEVKEADANETTELFKGESIFRNEKAFKTTVIRFAGLVGPGRHPSRFLSGKKVPGGGDPVNLIHLADCIRVIQSIIARNAWGGVYNACSDLHPAREEFYGFVCKQNNVAPPIFIAPENNAPKIVSNERLRRELGYVFTFPDPMTMTY